MRRLGQVLVMDRVMDGWMHVKETHQRNIYDLLMSHLLIGS